jgi:tetratricopeptide (TPR) repeat protein
VHPLHRGTTVALALTLLSGCALRHTRAPQPPLPPVNAAPAAAPESLSDYMQKVRHLSGNARPLNKNEAADMLETRDPAIAAELLLVSSHPTAERYGSLAERYRERGVLDAAYRNFNRAIALNPRDAAAYEGRARVWRDWGLPALAIGDAYRATYYAPRSASARNTYGTIMQALDRDDAARAAYETAIRLDPKAGYAVNNLCYLEFLQGRFDSAIETCTTALTIDRTLTSAGNNLALAFAAAGRGDLAQTQFADAGDRAGGLYNMGIAHLAAGDVARALNAFDEASKARPTFQLARERAAQIRAQMFFIQRQERLNRATVATERTNGASSRQDHDHRR